jgi:nitroreductase
MRTRKIHSIAGRRYRPVSDASPDHIVYDRPSRAWRERALGLRAQAIDVIDAIHTTGAQRRLRPDPISDEVIWDVLDAAIRGPSGGNRQGWRWIVVTDDAIKVPIAAYYLDAWNALHGGKRARLRQLAGQLPGRRDRQTDALERARQDPNYRAGEHLAENIGRAPVWIFAVVLGVRGEPSVVDGANIFGAVQNLMLAARAHGLGSTLTMLQRRHEAEVAALLGLPQDARAVALVPLGLPSSGTFFRTRREPVETVAYWDHWGVTKVLPAPSFEPAGTMLGVGRRLSDWPSTAAAVRRAPSPAPR